MANLIPTMGYYACDVTRIKNLASAGFLRIWGGSITKFVGDSWRCCVAHLF
ncbi:hypothetical protein GRZ17_005018 [Salmonella enterica]|nr:hypothetical protein [Salmonella enterica]